MSKVLLIFDDYSLLSQSQGALKRIGFDVLAISSEIGLSEQMISFNPEVVVAYGMGPRVSAISVARRLKDMLRWQGKTILIFPQNGKPNALDLIQVRMDLLLEHPVPLPKLIGVLARMMGLNEGQFLERYQKAEQAIVDKANSKQASEDSADIFVRSRETDSNDPASAFDKALDSWVKKAPAVGGENTPIPNPTEPGIRSGASTSEASSADAGLSSVAVPASGSAAVKEKLDAASELERDSTYVQGGSAEGARANLNADVHQAKQEVENISGVDTKAASQASAPTIQSQARDNDDLTESIKKVARDLAESKKKSGERLTRYTDKMQNLSLKKDSTVTRKKAKVALKDMSKDWKKDDLDHLDKLRREFTAAMFKKK